MASVRITLSREDIALIGEALSNLANEIENQIVTCPDPAGHRDELSNLEAGLQAIQRFEERLAAKLTRFGGFSSAYPDLDHEAALRRLKQSEG